MKTFFDMMREAQQSAFGAMMQKEFGLSAEQQAKAVEAMMPAFWLGLRKNAADPFGVAAFWQSVGTGPYRSYFDNPFAAMTPKAMDDGNGVLDKLFGSPDIARAVSLQVEAATGIAQDVVRRMMPVVANMMMGGLQRQSELAANPFLRFMQDFGQKDFGQPPREKPQAKTPDLPFVAMMNAFLGKPAEAEKEPEPEADGPMTNEEVIDRLFYANRSMQDAYWKSMQRIFDQFSPEKKD